MATRYSIGRRTFWPTAAQNSEELNSVASTGRIWPLLVVYAFASRSTIDFGGVSETNRVARFWATYFAVDGCSAMYLMYESITLSATFGSFELLAWLNPRIFTLPT